MKIKSGERIYKCYRVYIMSLVSLVVYENFEWLLMTPQLSLTTSVTLQNNIEFEVTDLAMIF